MPKEITGTIVYEETKLLKPADEERGGLSVTAIKMPATGSQAGFTIIRSHSWYQGETFIDKTYVEDYDTDSSVIRKAIYIFDNLEDQLLKRDGEL